MRLRLPNVLHNSVDFSVFEAFSNIVMGAIKSDIDKIVYIKSADKCPDSVLKALCDSLGCPYFEDAPKATRKLLGSWWNFISTKGTVKTIEAVASIAIEIFYEQNGIQAISGSFDVSIDTSLLDSNTIFINYQGIPETETETTAQLNAKCEYLMEQILSYVVPVCGVIYFMPSVIESFSDVLETVEDVKDITLPLEDNPQLITVSTLDLDDSYRICYGQFGLPNGTVTAVTDQQLTGEVEDNVLTFTLSNTGIVDHSITLTIGTDTVTNTKDENNPFGDIKWTNTEECERIIIRDNVIKLYYAEDATIPTSASGSWKYVTRYQCTNCPNATTCQKLTIEGVGVAEDSVLDGVNRIPEPPTPIPTLYGAEVTIWGSTLNIVPDDTAGAATNFDITDDGTVIANVPRES